MDIVWQSRAIEAEREIEVLRRALFYAAYLSVHGGEPMDDCAVCEANVERALKMARCGHVDVRLRKPDGVDHRRALRCGNCGMIIDKERK